MRLTPSNLPQSSYHEGYCYRDSILTRLKRFILMLMEDIDSNFCDQTED